MLPNFELINCGKYTEFLQQNSIRNFHELIEFVTNVPYGRTSNRSDFTLLFKENRGTCSLKHALLTEICALNRQDEIELIVGIFLMNEEYSSKIKSTLENNNLEAIPEAHSYLRYQNKRYDFTNSKAKNLKFESFLIREQRCEFQQVIDWKPMIHKNFISGWLKRKNLDITEEQLWEIREKCIEKLSE